MGAMGVLMVLACAICAGRAIAAWRRTTFNPLVQGSTPWRPTWENTAFLAVEQAYPPPEEDAQVLQSRILTLPEPGERQPRLMAGADRTGSPVNPIAIV
jgi:hypothetical protein